MSEFNFIRVDEENKLFDKKSMFYEEIRSDLKLVRFYTLVILQKTPLEILELNLLEQQLSELISNAIKHGNYRDVNKRIKI